MSRRVDASVTLPDGATGIVWFEDDPNLMGGWRWYVEIDGVSRVTSVDEFADLLDDPGQFIASVATLFGERKAAIQSATNSANPGKVSDVAEAWGMMSDINRVHQEVSRRRNV